MKSSYLRFFYAKPICFGICIKLFYNIRTKDISIKYDVQKREYNTQANGERRHQVVVGKIKLTKMGVYHSV